MGHNGPLGSAMSIYPNCPNISPVMIGNTHRGKMIPRQREKNEMLPEK
jgi:hypothetical protein